VIEVVDPIQALSMNRVEPQTPRLSKRSIEGDTKQASHSMKSGEDSVSVAFNLYGNLTQLHESVSVVYQEVKSQLERYYNVVPMDDEAKKRFEPPEDASAQKLMEFFSPANTATRIVDFATGYFSAYQQNHADKSNEENIDAFTKNIREAIEKGFKEAEKILGNFDELGDVGKNIKETYDKVIQKIDEYRTEYLHSLQGENAADTAPANASDTMQPSVPLE
jgi:hypothetical protein